ncbi:MAG TPA: cupin domain-containing protein [Egicoccus sp.]|nr:cupin domain-containing protein [Egicoccus sp.]HSK23047.1 cupin domain-containing protein [Egicoccus sp.]
MPHHAFVPGAWDRLQPVDSVAGSDGLRVGHLVGADEGSVHVELSVVELAPGGHVAGHLHPFEESFYLFEGALELAVDGRAHALVADDFGFVPVGVPHAWRNPGDRPARWYRVRAPQPRGIGPSDGTFPVAVAPSRGVEPVAELHPLSPHVGHFSLPDLPSPGPLAMPGAHGHNIRDVSVRMMVDDVLGAIHHQLFMVQFVPSTLPGFSGSAHFHAFEEAYLVVSGHGVVELEGERFDAGPGDLAWAGTGAMHAWTATGDEPLRFIELMVPRPPYTNMLFSEQTWRTLAEETLGDGATG